MEPKQITVEFVEGRYKALKAKWSERNTRMDVYEKLYRLELWRDSPEPDERRVTVPTCWNTVETNRTLLLTRPPVISVPPSQVKEIETERADRLEKVLYGTWRQGHVLAAAGDAEWYASCLGQGVLRYVYNPRHVEDEFPLLVQGVDPRNVYPNPSGQPFLDLEICHGWKRPRREIEAEWGNAFPRQEGLSGKALEEWLDEKVDFIDYWRVDVVEEEAGPEQKKERMEPVGSLARLIDGAKRFLGRQSTEEGEVPQGEQEGEEGEPSRGGASAVPTGKAGGARKVRRRKVTNCVVADGKMVKKAGRLPGYALVPYIRFPGIGTPLAGADGALSVLYPLTDGSQVGESGSMGVATAEAEAVSMRHRVVEMFATGAWWTDDPGLDRLDFTPGALNHLAKGTQVQMLAPQRPSPAVDEQVQLLDRYIEDSTFPSVMQGRYVGDLSGIALSALTNPVLMKIASRQQVRERAYELLNEGLLRLVEEYATGPEYPQGWYVDGRDAKGQRFELRVTPEDVAGYYRNDVKLSASLPKDETGELMALSAFVDKKQISRETFLDRLQQTKGMSSQSPQDEMKRILRDVMLFESPAMQRVAQLVLSEYSQELAEALQGQPQGLPQPGQPQPVPPPGPGGPGAGPMMGMPPQVVPPQAMPEAVGMGGAEDLARMMAMQGEAPPMPPPPGMPGPGGAG